jgi:hypothetical protein
LAELKGWSDHALEKVGRLTHPLRYDRETDRYVCWPCHNDEALDCGCRRLQRWR